MGGDLRGGVSRRPPAGVEVVIVVSGLMRSGTSALARMLAQMGVVMGESMLMPHAGSDAEWEDVALSSSLTGHALAGTMPTLDELRAYIVSRRSHHAEVSSALRVHREWGVKTPMAVLYLDELREAAAAEGEPVTLILTERDLRGTLDSLRRFGSFVHDEHRYIEMMFGLQSRLVDAREKHADDAALVVDISETWSDPKGVVGRLAEACGVRRFSWSDAVRGIEDRRG